MSRGRHAAGRGAVPPATAPAPVLQAERSDQLPPEPSPVPPTELEPSPEPSPEPPAAAPPGARGAVLTRDGWPLPGATVTVLGATGAQGARAASGPDGRFDLPGLAPGAATLLVAAPGYEPHARAITVPDQLPCDLGAVALHRQGAAELPPPGRWVIDAEHTSLVATAHHLGMSAVHGTLSRLEGVITVAEPFEASAVEVRIEAASISTGSARRDEHLRSGDLLDVEHHPWITFRGEGLRPAPAGGWLLDGELTLLGTARPVQLAMECTGTGQDAWGGTRVAFRATTQLSRDDYRMDWNQAVGFGVAVFGTTLRVALDVEAVLEG